MTHSKRQLKINAVWDTWGPKCDYLLVASNHTDPTINAIAMQSEPSYENLWDKLNETMHYISKTTNQFQDYNWYYKVDDDTFVIMENLHAFLESPIVQDKAKGNNLPLLYGRNFAFPEYRTLRFLDTFFYNNSLNQHFKKRFFSQYNGTARLLYPSGGSGYVMNPNPILCRTFLKTLQGPDTLRGIPDEDMALAINLLHHQGIRPQPSRDINGLQLFHPELPPVMYHLPTGTADWLLDNHKEIPGGIQSGANCCSPYSISFHHASPPILRYMQHRIYQCRRKK